MTAAVRAKGREKESERERVGWYLPLCKYIDGSLRDALFPFAFFFSIRLYTCIVKKTPMYSFFSLSIKKY